MKETNAQMLKRLRVDAVARGLCYMCRCRFPKPGRRICEDCKGRSERWKNGTKKGIAARRMYNKKRAARRAAERRLAGLCVQCGRRPLIPGYARCSVCLDSRAARARSNARANGHEPDGRRCSVCGSPNHFASRHERPGVLP